QVHAYVVVFEVGAWRHRLAALALAALIGPRTGLPVVVDLIGLAPQLTLPLARLLQQVAPGDARVVLTGKPGTLHRSPDRFADVGDTAVGNGEARQHAKVAPGDGKGHSRAHRVAPFGQHPSTLQDDAGRPTAGQHGPDDLAPRSRLVPLDVAHVASIRVIEAPRPGTVMGEREFDGRIEASAIKAGVGGAEAGPVCRIGHIVIPSVFARGRSMHLTFPSV